MTELHVVIVTWNTREMTLDAIQSVLADLNRSPYAGTVWVVDNASTDGTAAAIRQRFPEVALLEPGENLGFAAGNNLALRRIGFGEGAAPAAALPDYVLLLNPDTIVHPGALEALVTAMAQTGAGLAGARLTFGDGSFQHSAFGFPDLWHLLIELFPVPGRLIESSLNGRYPRDLYAVGEPFTVDHPLGATFMLRREVIAQTGLFDEGYALYSEEVDWAMRIKQAGWGAICVPAAHVTHFGGASSGQVRPQATLKKWQARLRFYQKHYPPLTNVLARTLIRMGMRRAITMIARDSSLTEEDRRQMVNAFRAVITASRKSQL